jgi:hypothetical protein
MHGESAGLSYHFTDNEKNNVTVALLVHIILPCQEEKMEGVCPFSIFTVRWIAARAGGTGMAGEYGGNMRDL